MTQVFNLNSFTSIVHLTRQKEHVEERITTHNNSNNCKNNKLRRRRELE